MWRKVEKDNSNKVKEYFFETHFVKIVLFSLEYNISLASG